MLLARKRVVATCAWIVIILLVIGCHDAKKSSPSTGAAGSSGTGASNGSNGARDVTTRDARPDESDAITAFWRWFAANAAALRADTDLQQAMERIGAELERVDPGVIAEIAKDGDKRTLILSADGDKDLFPVVQAVYARRPTVEGWEIVAFRPRSDLSNSIEMEGSKVKKMSDVKFIAERAGDKLDVRLFIPAYTETEQMQLIGFLLLDHAVGEYDMETKIGGVEFDSIAHAPRSAKSLTELPALVDALEER